MLRTWVKSTLAATAIGAALAGTAGAQGFNFNTRGEFTTAGFPTCTTAAAISVTCVDPTIGSTLQLKFDGVNNSVANPFGFLTGSTVTLGKFTVSGNGNVFDLPNNVVSFKLWIDQISPTNQTSSTVGFITGTLERPVGGLAFSDLVWRPTEIVTIGPVTYDLIFRDDPPTGIVLSASGETTVEAIATVVPEPSTYALMATGLAGLLFAARRRRRV